MLYHDVLIVGGGLSGLRAAVGLCEKYDVGLVSKVHPIRSHSIAAQGGINAALANNPDALAIPSARRAKRKKYSCCTMIEILNLASTTL